MRAVKNDFKGTSCQLSLCDLDEACILADGTPASRWYLSASLPHGTMTTPLQDTHDRFEPEHHEY